MNTLALSQQTLKHRMNAVCTHYLTPGAWCPKCGKEKEVLGIDASRQWAVVYPAMRYGSTGSIPVGENCGPGLIPADRPFEERPPHLAMPGNYPALLFRACPSTPPQHSEEYKTALWDSIVAACRP